MKHAASRILSKLGRVTGLALWVVLAVSASAQQVPDANANQNDSTKQLLDRITELEAKVKQLEEKQATTTSLSPASSPEPAVIASRAT